MKRQIISTVAAVLLVATIAMATTMSTPVMAPNTSFNSTPAFHNFILSRSQSNISLFVRIRQNLSDLPVNCQNLWAYRLANICLESLQGTIPVFYRKPVRPIRQT